MAAPQVSRVVELARGILAKATQLDEHCDANGLAKPSFDHDFPTLSLEMEGVRMSILESTDEMNDLMLGPQGLAETGPPQHLTYVGIQAIVRFGIAVKLGFDEEIPYTELAARCDLPVDDTTRLLRCAIARHVFKEPKEGYVAHTAASKHYVNNPVFCDFITTAFEEIWPASAHMVDAMAKWKGSQETNQTGWNAAKGTDDSFFESFSKNSRRADAFANTMKYVQSRPGMLFSAATLLEDFDWAPVKTVVDVGGGTGDMCADIARKHTSIQCTVQDLASAIAVGRDTIAKDVSSRVEFMEHNFFNEQPIKDADVYLIRAILHDWPDKKAIEILQNLTPALKDGANIVLQEIVMPPHGMLPAYHEKSIRAADMAMKATFNSKERTVGDWTNLCAAADPRLVVTNVKMAQGSMLATIELTWQAEATGVKTNGTAPIESSQPTEFSQPPRTDAEDDMNVVLKPGQSELDRLALSFAVVEAHFQRDFQSLIVAPLDLHKPGLRILDQACADGRWLHAIRGTSPSPHTYLGTDLESSYFPTPPPPFTSFQQQSMTSPWPPSLQSSFDLVHSRFNLAGAGTFPLQQVVNGLIGLLAPGGWIQLEEMQLQRTVELNAGEAARQTYGMLAELFRLLGAGDDFAGRMGGWCEEGGLVDVVEREVVVDMGVNAAVGGEGVGRERVGEMGVEAMARTVQGLVDGSKDMPLTTLTKEELQSLPERIRRECETIGSSYSMTVVVGRKPL